MINSSSKHIFGNVIINNLLYCFIQIDSHISLFFSAASVPELRRFERDSSADSSCNVQVDACSDHLHNQWMSLDSLCSDACPDGSCVVTFNTPEDDRSGKEVGLNYVMALHILSLLYGPKFIGLILMKLTYAKQI